MEFPTETTVSTEDQIDETSILKDDDSPLQQINEQSLAQDLEKNRESLKRKLQTRRSMKQLVDVGIMPSPKTPLPFYEQQKQLRLRKTQDMLRYKIISRPDRQLLIEHNILSDTTAAPAIQNTQRQLKRARLADNLNDKLAARPGVLELVANNILEIDPTLKEAIKGGRIQFPSTKSSSTPPILPTPVINSIDSQPRPLRPKTSSNTLVNGQNSTNTKRSLGSTTKAKSSLTFHEYKGPSQKVEVTKVPLQPTPSLIVQPVQATFVVPIEQKNDNHYLIQLRQQQLFLELLHDNKTNENEDENENKEDNLIGNLLQQPIDESVNLFSTTIQEETYHFEKMKLADLKNECRKLKLSTTGTKMKLIEKLRIAKSKMSDASIIPSTNESISTAPSPSSVRLLISTSSLTDQELYQQQQQKLVELEKRLQQLKQFDGHSVRSLDQSTTVSQKCNPILSTHIQKKILLQQQEKLKQRIHEEQQQQQQSQHSIVPLTPESVARFLANQNQSQSQHQIQTSNQQPWSMHHSVSAPTLPTYADNHFYGYSHSMYNQSKLIDDDVFLNLLDDYTDPHCQFALPPDDSLSMVSNSYVSSSPSTHMDWMSITSPTITNDFYDDNNPDFTQFLNQLGNEHQLLFDSQLSTCQQQTPLTFDLLSPSSPMI